VKNLNAAFGAVLLGLLFTACVEEKYPDYSVTENDVYYKLVATDGNDRHPEPGDYLSLDVKYFSLDDSLFYDSQNESRDGRMTAVVPDSCISGGYFDALSTLTIGDSAALLIATTVFFNEYQKQAVPAHLAKYDRVKIEVRLENVQTLEEVQAEQLATQEQLLQLEREEQVMLKNYLKAEGVDSSHFYRGLYIIPIEEGSGEKASNGKHVTLHFRGTTLAGKQFDSTYDRGAPLDFRVGSPGIVIAGIEIGVKRLRAGSKAKFILPSQLAFGSRGVPGIVDPYATLIYEIELIKLN
jgi:FKBP-type peptidyl-prolyl cis-trans isomerase